MESDSVPLISLKGFFSDDPLARQTVVDEVRKACLNCGFFMIQDHQANEEVIETAWKSCRDFFDSPLPNKESVPSTGDYPYGYVGIAGEIAGGSLDYGKADMKESFSICLGSSSPDPQMPAPRWPTQPSHFPDAVSAYYREMEKLARILLRILALGLQLDEHYFDPLENHHWSALRCLNYPHSDKPFQPGQLRISAHTDYGTITILRADNSPGGLQVQKKDGTWADVVFPPGVFTINLGDLMQRWTNDLYKSTMHRVVPPPVVVRTNGENSSTGTAEDNRRQSIAFFHNLNRDAICSTFPSCITADRPSRYEPINAFDHLMSRHAAAVGYSTRLDSKEGVKPNEEIKVGGADITGNAWKSASSSSSSSTASH